jgi:hypothetical protein
MSGELLLANGTSCNTPSSGYTTVFAKTTGLCEVDSSGTERSVVTADNAAVGVDLALNPGQETVLPGTHTTAITQINAASTTRNMHIVGWQFVTGTGTGGDTPDCTVTQDTSVVTGASNASAKIVVTVLGTSNPVYRQLWNAAQYLEKQVYAVRGRVFNFAAAVKQSAATANACRLYITTNGTGGTTTYSTFHGANTDWERLIVTVTVPVDATEISFGLVLANATPDYYFDNAMVVATSVAQTSLEWQPRNPVALSSSRIDSTEQLIYTTPADANWHTTGDGTADADYSINDNRPAWASMAIIKSQVGGTGGAGTDFSVRPSGDTNTWFPAFSQVSGVALESMGTCVFGANGQIDFRCGHTNTDGYFFIKMWQGVNL